MYFNKIIIGTKIVTHLIKKLNNAIFGNKDNIIVDDKGAPS